MIRFKSMQQAQQVSITLDTEAGADELTLAQGRDGAITVTGRRLGYRDVNHTIHADGHITRTGDDR